MITFELSNKNLFINNELLKLSLLIGRDNFLFALKGLADGKIKSVRQFSLVNFKDESDLLKMLSDAILEFNYNSPLIQKAVISIITPEFTIVPTSFSGIIDEKAILAPVSIKQYFNDHQIIKSEIPKINSNAYFPVQTELLDIMSNNFKSYTIHHCNDCLIQYATDLIEKTDYVLCNFSVDSIQVLVYTNSGLKASNVFLNTAKDEILYSILSIYYKHGLLISNVPLYLCGRIEVNSLIHNTLNDHIKKIEFVNFRSSAYFSKIFNSVPDHFFFDVSLLSGCV